MTTKNFENTKGLFKNGFMANQKIARWLALGAVAGPVLLTFAWIILGLIRPETRNEWGVSGGITGMITQPFSGLGIGPNGSLFNLAFLLNGILIIVGVFGVFQTIESGRRPTLYKVSAALLGLSGLGSVICAVFTLESFFPHMLGFILAVGIPILGFLTTGYLFRDIPRWRKLGTWLIVASPLTLLLLVFFFITFQYDTMSAALGVAGLTERILVIEVQTWYVTMGWLAFRHQDEISLPM